MADDSDDGDDVIIVPDFPLYNGNQSSGPGQTLVEQPDHISHQTRRYSNESSDSVEYVDAQEGISPSYMPSGDNVPGVSSSLALSLSRPRPRPALDEPVMHQALVAINVRTDETPPFKAGSSDGNDSINDINKTFDTAGDVLAALRNEGQGTNGELSNFEFADDVTPLRDYHKPIEYKPLDPTSYVTRVFNMATLSNRSREDIRASIQFLKADDNGQTNMADRMFYLLEAKRSLSDGSSKYVFSKLNDRMAASDAERKLECERREIIRQRVVSLSSVVTPDAVQSDENKSNEIKRKRKHDEVEDQEKEETAVSNSLNVTDENNKTTPLEAIVQNDTKSQSIIETVSKERLEEALVDNPSHNKVAPASLQQIPLPVELTLMPRTEDLPTDTQINKTESIPDPSTDEIKKLPTPVRESVIKPIAVGLIGAETVLKQTDATKPASVQCSNNFEVESRASLITDKLTETGPTSTSSESKKQNFEAVIKDEFKTRVQQRKIQISDKTLDSLIDNIIKIHIKTTNHEIGSSQDILSIKVDEVLTHFEIGSTQGMLTRIKKSIAPDQRKKTEIMLLLRNMRSVKVKTENARQNLLRYHQADVNNLPLHVKKELQLDNQKINQTWELIQNYELKLFDLDLKLYTASKFLEQCNLYINKLGKGEYEVDFTHGMTKRVEKMVSEYYAGARTKMISNKNGIDLNTSSGQSQSKNSTQSESLQNAVFKLIPTPSQPPPPLPNSITNTLPPLPPPLVPPPESPPSIERNSVLISKPKKVVEIQTGDTTDPRILRKLEKQRKRDEEEHINRQMSSTSSQVSEEKRVEIGALNSVPGDVALAVINIPLPPPVDVEEKYAEKNNGFGIDKSVPNDISGVTELPDVDAEEPTKIPDDEQMICTSCSEIFGNYRALAIHFATHHSDGS